MIQPEQDGPGEEQTASSHIPDKATSQEAMALDHLQQPAGFCTPSERDSDYQTSLVGDPLAVLKQYGDKFDSALTDSARSLVRAEEFFGSLHVTVEADRSRPQYPHFVTLAKVPDLRGINPYRLISPHIPDGGSPENFFAVVTISLPNRLSLKDPVVRAGIEPGLASGRELPHIPRNEAVLLWLEHDADRQCYTIRRPNPRGLFDRSDVRFSNLAPHQKLPVDRWGWNVLEKRLRIVLPKGLIAEDRHGGGLREILNDAIDVRVKNDRERLPEPYKMLEYLLDALAIIDGGTGGNRPVANSILREAERFAAEHNSIEKSRELDAMMRQAGQVLDLDTNGSTITCLGKLVKRLEREVLNGSAPSRLSSDLRDLCTKWGPVKIKSPSCIQDFMSGVSSLIRGTHFGSVGQGDTGRKAAELLKELEAGLREWSAPQNP